MTPLDPEAFRRALRALASTVHLITYRNPEGQVEGMTATSVTSLSLAPPTLLVCINQSTRAHGAIEGSHIFSISVLASTQRSIAETAGRVGSNKEFGGSLTTETDPNRVPTLEGSLATFHCRVLGEHHHFTHTVFVAEVLDARPLSAGSPLLHFQSGYRTVSEASEGPDSRGT